MNAAGNPSLPARRRTRPRLLLFDGSTALASTWIYSYSDWVPGALTWVIPGNGASHTIQLEYRANNTVYEAAIPYFTTQAQGVVAPVMTFLTAPTS